MVLMKEKQKSPQPVKINTTVSFVLQYAHLTLVISALHSLLVISQPLSA